MVTKVRRTQEGFRNAGVHEPRSHGSSGAAAGLGKGGTGALVSRAGFPGLAEEF